MPKVSFIGSGRMSAQHALAFSDIKGVSLSGVLSRSRKNAEEFAAKFSIPNICDSIENLWNSTHSDVLVISVPPSVLLSLALEVVKYPWHCLFEKPLGLNLSEARLIVDSVKTHRSNSFIGLNRRHMSSTINCLDSLSSTDDVRVVTVSDQQNPLIALKRGHPQAVVNNWHFANSIHTVDYFSLFCRGNLLSVESLTPNEFHAGFFKCSSLIYDSGDYGLYMGLWDAPGPWGVSVSTKAQRLDMQPLERSSRRLISDRLPTHLPVAEWDNTFKPGFRRQAQLLVDSLDAPTPTLPTVFDGLKTMEVIDRLFIDSLPFIQ